MSGPASAHDASASIDGSLAQFDYALLLLAQGESTRVGIETLDDVVAESDDGGTTQSQLKQSLAESGYAISLRSIGLWKTLAIWVDAIQADSSKLDTTRFHIVATRVSAQATIAAFTKDVSATEATTLADALLKAAKDPTEVLRPHMNKVVACPRHTLEKLLCRIRLIQKSVPANAAELKSKLSIPADVDADELIQALRGWISSLAREQWGNKQPCWIDVEAFNTRRHHLCKRLERNSRRVRPWNAIVGSLTPKTQQHEAVFIKQLNLIKADAQEIEDAVVDYLNHGVERSRLSIEGDMGEDEWNELDNGLLQQWKPRWRQAKEDTHSAADVVGRRLYREICSLQPLQLASGLGTHLQFCCGGYHRLANERKVGWHPNFDTLLQASSGTGGNS